MKNKQISSFEHCLEALEIVSYLFLLSFPLILFLLIFQLRYIFLKYLSTEAFFTNGTKRQHQAK